MNKCFQSKLVLKKSELLALHLTILVKLYTKLWARKMVLLGSTSTTFVEIRSKFLNILLNKWQ